MKSNAATIRQRPKLNLQRKGAAPQTGAAEETGSEVADETEQDTPALILSGLQFFIFDSARKHLMWLESGSQSFSSKVTGLQQAPIVDALRLLTSDDRKTMLRLLKGALQDGKAGPFDVGGGADLRIPGVPLVVYRHDLSDGKQMAIGFPSLGEDDENVGQIVLGLAPILQHFVQNSNRIVLLVDNFGYIRFASEGFLSGFRISDPKMVIGRNVSHVQARIGRTIVSLSLAALTRRANASGKGKFLLANGDSIELSFDAMYFRLGGSVGGVLFSAGRVSGEVDYSGIFNYCSAAMLVVNLKTRKIMAANAAAMKAYHLTAEVIDTQAITERLLHASSFSTLLEAARSKNEVPQSVVVNSFDGKSKKKRLKAIIIDQDSDPKLLLESRA